MKEERKPDLVDPDYEAAEKHVDEMLSPDLELKPKANKIVVKDHDELQSNTDDIPSAPEIVKPKSVKKPVAISIKHETEEEKPKAELEAAIEAANEQLVEELPGPPPLADAAIPDEPSIEDAANEPETVDTESIEVDVDEKPEADTTNDVDNETEVNTRTLEPQELPAESDESETDEPLPDVLDDPKTDQAVDEILAEESDKLLEVDSGDLPESNEEKLSFGSKIAGLFGLYWHSRVARWFTLLLIFGLAGTAGAVPVTRYYALNAVGVRSSATVEVYDETTFQPVKGAQFKIADQSVQTDVNGKARISNLKLGKTQLVVQKYAYGVVNKQVTIGWGSNPFGKINVTPAGNQYTINITDYLSAKPVAKVLATAGQADAQSDDKGVIKLAMDHNSATTVDVVVTAEGYRDEKFTLNLADSKKVTDLKLVPSNKAVFISKRSGKLDIYSKYIDGTNEQKILDGTGNEQDNIVLVPSIDGQVAALVSTRDNLHNTDGFLLSTLTMIDLKGSTSKTVTHSEQVYVVGWVGSRLIYVQTASGTSAANPNRQRLMSYDYKTSDNHQLASTNYFNDVMLVGGKIYFAPSSTYQAPGVAINFFVINPDGSGKQTILAQETWSAYRISHDEIVLSVPNQQWYSYKMAGTPTKLDGTPGNLSSKVYVDSPDGKHSLWVDLRDGKGVLLSYDIDTKKDAILQTKNGLTTPVRWLNNNSVVYRIKNDQETADYAVSINGGEPHKIADVTNTGGIDKWYYY